MTESQTTPQQKSYKILLIGDNCTDIYQYGTVDRISPEAPVPIFNLKRTEYKSGMAANVQDNLINLGCEVNFFHGLRTTIKTRMIDQRTNQHILRVDQDLISKPLTIGTIETSYDAIVISDYNKGTVSYELVKELRKNFDGPIFIDTKKKNLVEFEGCFVKINELEYNAAESHCSEMIVTHGSGDVVYKDKKFSVPKVDVFDVCGAGDTFLAALAYAYCVTKDIEYSIRFAIRASTITIQHMGVYAPTLEEINET